MVLLRGTDSCERTRWTGAREIGHLVLHRYGDVSDDEEREASRFASELLTPAEAIAAEIPAAPTLKDLIEVKLKWRISVGALIIHFRESKLIDAARTLTLQRQLYTRINTDTGHTWGKTEPGWDTYTPEKPRLLRRWMGVCYAEADSAEALVAHNLIYPTHLLADILAGQGNAPGQSQTEHARTANAGVARGDTVVPLRRAPR